MSTKEELGKAGVTVLPPATPEQPESQIIIERLRALGYEFRLNSCADTVEVNGRPITEILEAEIRMRLRDIGLAKKIAAAEDAYLAEAKKNAYHPVRDYLDGLVWDGGDHITALTSHLYSNDPPVVYRGGASAALHHVYFYRWLIGAVAKVYTGAQNALLVLDGNQGIGKSTLAHWLCPLSEFFLEGPINPTDKDSDVRLISQWIWEVSELDATTRKADQSALKSFITKEVVTVRKSYGRHDTKKMAMCSLIGTVNNTSGFLADESGSRRFMITKLDRIDRAYQKLDVSQVWAHAKQLYFDGEVWQLRGEEAAAQAAINERYEAETTLTDWLQRYFFFDRTAETAPLSLADIIRAMDLDGYRLSGSERSQAMELSRVLTKLGAQREHTREGNRWLGLYAKPKS
jgi:predicted P-loop ATPase